MVYLFAAFVVVCILIAIAPRAVTQVAVVAAWVLMAFSGIISVGYEFIRRL